MAGRAGVSLPVVGPGKNTDPMKKGRKEVGKIKSEDKGGEEVGKGS